MDRWILAVDLGNGGPKVAVVAPDGEIAGSAARSVGVHVGLSGAATQDANEWWSALVAAARQAIAGAGAAPDGLQAVGITGQWGSTVPVDATGQPVGDVLLWADTRARDLVRDVIGGRLAVGGISPVKALPFLRLTAGAPSPSGSDPTGHALLLRERLPEVYARTSYLIEPVDYLGLRFTGRIAATPASMALSWLTDNRPGAPAGYVGALVTRARRDPARLPELLPTGSVLGPLRGEVAEEMGVAAGAPVVCGIPDLHAAVLGSGTVGPFETHIAVSTTQWIGARVPFKRTDPFRQIATVPGLDLDHPVVANNQETGAAALQWLHERIFAPNGGVPDALDGLVRLAAAAPAGSEGALFMPWLNGERSPVEDKLARGGWLNVSLRTDRAMLVRSVLEGVAYNARWLFQAYQKFLRRTVSSVRILGGGAQSDLWCQIYADVLGVAVEQVADPRLAQARGVALWTRICRGEIALAEVAPLVPVAARFIPSPSAHAEYGRYYREYRRLHRTLKGLYARLNGP